jgi:hypothetical protein
MYRELEMKRKSFIEENEKEILSGQEHAKIE